jgi:hypothetical protein
MLEKGTVEGIEPDKPETKSLPAKVYPVKFLAFMGYNVREFRNVSRIPVIGPRSFSKGDQQLADILGHMLYRWLGVLVW